MCAQTPSIVFVNLRHETPYGTTSRNIVTEKKKEQVYLVNPTQRGTRTRQHQHVLEIQKKVMQGTVAGTSMKRNKNSCWRTKHRKCRCEYSIPVNKIATVQLVLTTEVVSNRCIVSLEIKEGIVIAVPWCQKSLVGKEPLREWGWHGDR